MTTDTSERGLETLIMRYMTGRDGLGNRDGEKRLIHFKKELAL